MKQLNKRFGAAVARWAHNPKVRGSKPRIAIYAFCITCVSYTTQQTDRQTDRQSRVCVLFYPILAAALSAKGYTHRLLELTLRGLKTLNVYGLGKNERVSIRGSRFATHALIPFDLCSLVCVC